jgi:hypothetical protein
MTDAADRNPGDNISLYCSDCREEQTFIWTEWGGTKFFDYPAGREYGWECSVCGSRLSET